MFKLLNQKFKFVKWSKSCEKGAHFLAEHSFRTHTSCETLSGHEGEEFHDLFALIIRQLKQDIPTD